MKHNKAEKKEKDCMSLGDLEIFTGVIGKKIKWKDTVSMVLVMGRFMKGKSEKELKKDLEPVDMRMEESIKVIGNKIIK